MHYLALAVIFALGSSANGRPSIKLPKDDIILISEQLQYFEGNPEGRVVKSWSEYYWKGRTLVYSFAGGFSSLDIASIESAMAEISSKTCVKFRRTEYKREPQVVIQKEGSGCWSYVGYLGRTDQALNLGSGCMSSRTIQHELLHALGFFHTHSDPQRDKYVRIQSDNIRSGHEHNFQRLRANGVTNYGFGYDYDSIMHYGPFAFSKNGKSTIVPLRSQAKIGQATQMSPKDVQTLKRMYC
ncbi:zinc metalloproteinase nas-4 [Drosophila sechellia]|uniref:Metalloendopeptidase n=1 Tax=Drosophila sechellia TaxID=7238 RepID=B4HXR7_DROSE|nr:zinc metalloproteinase nas-4 [Drosophila sechellia]EDW51847.1 GM16101 [Drosophila sechellia]